MAKLFPALNVLEKGEMEQIHEASLVILKDVGISLPHEGILASLQRAGAEIDFERQVAKIPPALVEEAVKRVSRSEWKLYGVDGTYGVNFDGANIAYSTARSVAPAGGFVGGFSMHVYDGASGTIRQATANDVIDSIRLADTLPNIQVVGPPVSDQTVPPKIRVVDCAVALLSNTSKPGHIETFTLDALKWVVKIGEAALGGAEELRKKPVFIAPLAATSPLRYSPSVLECAEYLAGKGLPIEFYTLPMSTLSAPATLAGALALGNAEIWAGVVFTKLLDKQAHVGISYPIYGRHPVLPVDMKTLGYLYSSPEHQLATIAAIQLYRDYYKVPYRGGCGVRTDSNIPDLQAGVEKAFTGLTAMLAGATSIGNLGFLGSDKIFSYEQLLIDNEILNMLNRMPKGIEVNPDTMALDVVKHVGIGGSFLAEMHTVKHLRSEFWLPDLFQRLGLEAWEKGGRITAFDKAGEKVAKLLASPRRSPLDKATTREIENIAAEARKALFQP